MPATRIDLSSYMADTSATISAAINIISDAQRAQKSAADKCARVLAPASLAASESSTAQALFRNVDDLQGDLVAAGLDPSKVCAALLEQAARLAQSAKSRLVDASAAAA